MKKLIMVILASISMNAMADQLIFSQYDGVSKWNNVILNVTSAKIFIEPGVAFVAATDGYKNIVTPGQFGVPAVAWSGSTIKVTHDNTTLDLVQSSPGATTFNVSVTTGSGTTSLGTHDLGSIPSINDDVVFLNGLGINEHNIGTSGSREVDAVEGIEATKDRFASKEEPQEAKAIVFVPADADMHYFMLYFLDIRVPYLELLDYYQNMYPLKDKKAQ